jgi:hypothetical protein
MKNTEKIIVGGGGLLSKEKMKRWVEISYKGSVSFAPVKRLVQLGPTYKYYLVALLI